MTTTQYGHEITTRTDLGCMSQVRRANAARGHHFFEPATKRFFRSRVGAELHGGRYFVTSEQGPDGIRAYTVRAVMDDGVIETMGSFQQYASRSGAVSAARRLAGELDGAAVVRAEVVMANARAARTGHDY